MATSGQRGVENAAEAVEPQLEAEGHAGLPEGLTPQALRRTFGSLLIALGHDPAYVKQQMGNTSSVMTLDACAQSIRPENRAKLGALVRAEFRTSQSA